jgi:hypothetical protein
MLDCEFMDFLSVLFAVLITGTDGITSHARDTVLVLKK